MIIHHVEGDQGHLMNEEMGHQIFRVAVRGSCVRYQMPWEVILEQMNKHRAGFVVHLQVNGVDFKKHLKQVM
eukprot:12410431-Karenia_brevis.AAC.1